MYPKSKNSLKSSYSNNLLLTGVDDTDGLVLAGGADETAITVPGDIVNDIRMHVLQGDHGFTCAHVPDDDLVVTTWQEYIKKHKYFYFSRFCLCCYYSIIL